jgi:hypothetical protein
MLQERDFMPVRARVRSHVSFSRAGAFRGAAHFYNHVAFQVALKPLLFVRICQKT